MREFIWSTRVYYEDTDAAGVVYHTNYLKYMERTRTEWLRTLGFSQESMRQNENIIFVIKHLKVKFARPARFDDLLDINAKIIRAGGASLLFEQIITNGEHQICLAEVEVACLDAETYKPRRIPQCLKEKLKHVN